MLRFETISAAQIDQYVYAKNALIIDVREEMEYQKSHIENAINIPFSKLEKKYKKMPKDMILVLYCNTGGNSLLAAKELFDYGCIVKAVIGGIRNYKGKHMIKA